MKLTRDNVADLELALIAAIALFELLAFLRDRRLDREAAAAKAAP